MLTLSRHAVAFLVLSVASLTSACTGGEQHEAIVSSIRSPCMGVGAQMCLNMQEEGSSAMWLYDGIEGFTHRWGINTKLRYVMETVENPPEDGSSLRYVLDTVLSEVSDPAGSLYDLSFPASPPGTGWFETSSSGLSMVGTQVSCDAAVCADILARTQANTAFVVTFELTSDATVPLHVSSVR